MPNPTDPSRTLLERVATLLKRSQQLKDDAVRLLAEAEMIDGAIEEVLERSIAQARSEADRLCAKSGLGESDPGENPPPSSDEEPPPASDALPSQSAGSPPCTQPPSISQRVFKDEID